MVTKEYKRDFVQEWRDKKRAQGLCQCCGKNPIFTKRINNGITRTYSKCRPCLIRNALEQSIRREKIKNGRLQDKFFSKSKSSPIRNTITRAGNSTK